MRQNLPRRYWLKRFYPVKITPRPLDFAPEKCEHFNLLFVETYS
jgi:hypothetical protein